jgi:HTH-like domain
MRYQTNRADDASLRQRMTQERRRFGYRRLHVLLKPEGYVVNHKKLFRLYREEKPGRTQNWINLGGKVSECSYQPDSNRLYLVA